MRHVVQKSGCVALTMAAVLAAACRVASPPRTVPSLILYARGADRSLGGGIVDINSGEVTVLPEGEAPIGWSPSRTRLLLFDVDNELVMVSDIWGQGQQIIFRVEEGLLLLDARWITDDTVLASVGESALPPLPLHTYAVSVTSGAATLLEPDVPRYIEAVSPDGSYWVEYLYPRLDVVRLDGSRQELDVGLPIGHEPFQAANRPSLAILPSGEEVVFVSCAVSDQVPTASCALYLARVFPATGEAPRRLPDHGDNLGLESLRVSPDGRFLALVSLNDSSIVIIDLRGGAEPRVVPWGQSNRAPDFVWSPIGNAITAEYFDASSSEFVLEVIDIQTGERRAILSDPRGYFVPVDWAMINSGD